jgi:hypothetical protein
MKKNLTFPHKIFLVAFILRLVPVLLTSSLGIGLDDMFQYDTLARSLSSGNGFRWYAYDDLKRLEPFIEFDLSSIDYDPERGLPTSFRAPLYPAFLALIYSVASTGAGRFFAARLVQVGINALMAPLTYWISHQIYKDDEKISIRASWVVASYPLLLIYPIGLATENLFFVLVLAAFFFLLKIPDSERTTQPTLLAGVFLALAALTRSVILPFAGLALLWVGFVLKQKRNAVYMLMTISILIAPWIIRNSLLHKRLTGIDTSMGYNLYLGYHPASDGSFTFGASLDLLSIMDDAERDQTGIELALKFIRADPKRIWPLALNRLGFFFGLEKRALVYFYSNNLLGYIPLPLLLVVTIIFLVPFIALSTSAVLGTAFTRFSKKTVLLYLLLLIYILPHIFILAEDRFHLTIIPFLALFAAKAWTDGIPTFKRRWQETFVGKIVLILTILIIFLLLANWSWELFRDWDKISILLGPEGNQSHFTY